MKKLFELQKYEAFKFLSFAIAVAITGCICIGMTVQDVISSSKTPVDFNDMALTQCEPGTHVTGDVYGTLGYYWESYETHNGVKQEASTERIYLIPFGTEGKYIGLNVRKYEFDRFETLTDATYEALFENGDVPEQLTGYEGYIKKCDARMNAALEETYASIGGTGNVNDVFVPYYIEQSSGASIIMTMLGVGFMLVALVLFIVFAVKLKNEKQVMGNQVYLGKIIFDRNDYIIQTQPELYNDKVYRDAGIIERPERMNAFETMDEPNIEENIMDEPDLILKDSESGERAMKDSWEDLKNTEPEPSEEKKSEFSLRLKSED